MDMHRQMKSSSLANQKAKNVVLKRTVLLLAGNTAEDKPAVDVFRLFPSRIGEFCRTEIGHFKLHGDPTLFLIVLEHAADEGQIAGKVWGQLLDVLLLRPA